MERRKTRNLENAKQHAFHESLINRRKNKIFYCQQRRLGAGIAANDFEDALAETLAKMDKEDKK